MSINLLLSSGDSFLIRVFTTSYERVVRTIYRKGPQGVAAARIIAWVACAKRPLRWGEVQATFFVEPLTSMSDFEGRRLRKSCKQLCGSLVDVSKAEGSADADAVLHFVHDTARE